MDPYTLEPIEPIQKQGFHALLRFLRVVNRHKMVLAGLVAAAACFAVVRHKRIPKQYESTARVMIQKAHSDVRSNSKNATQGLLASYKQLLLSDTVMIRTVERLSEMPPELIGNNDKATWPRVVRRMLNVTFDPTEHVLSMSCRSRSPKGALDVIQALMVASSTFMEEYQQDMSFVLMKQLEAKRAQIERELLDKEQQLLLKRRECGDIAVGDGKEEAHPIVQRVAQVNKELISVRGRRLELQSMLATARRQVAAGVDLTASLQRLEAIVGTTAMSRIPGLSTADPQMLEKLMSDLSVMEAEFASLRRHFGLGHSDMRRRQSQIDTQRQRIGAAQQGLNIRVSTGIRDPRVGWWLINTISEELTTTQQYETTLKNDYDIAEKEAIELSNKLAFISFATREVDLLREQHSSLSNRLSSIRIEQGAGTFRVALLSDPLLPKSAVYPVLTQTMALFCVAAAAAGLGIIYVIDLLDDRLRSPEEVRDELGLSVLGVIRRLPDDENDEAKIYIHSFPATPHAECFRTLKTVLTFSASDTRCLAVTSAEAGEGKTTTTVNVAAAYAQAGQRTLLIDADMRRPGLSRLLEVRGHGGLSELLRAESNLPEMCRERIVSTDAPLLDVLPCGPRTVNPGTLLSLPVLADILDWAVSEYDQVIVDCPPTLPVSDAAIVGRFVDGILFLMNPDKTHRRSVTRAVDQLRVMGLKIVGIVANTSLNEEDSSYGYGYGYGYGESYGNNGDFDDEDDSELNADALGKAA